MAEAANLREQRDWKIGKGVLKVDFNAGSREPENVSEEENLVKQTQFCLIFRTGLIG